MRTAAASFVALGALLQGCIIYETEHDLRDDCWERGACDTAEPRRDDDDDVPCPTGDCATGDDDGDATTPTTPEPEPAIDLTLSVTEAAQGDTLLIWLQASDPAFDYRRVSSVAFVGDVEVVELVTRPDEAFLLAEVAGDAELGVVQVFVEFTDADAALIPGGFTIVEGAGSGGGSTGGTTPCGC